MTEPSALDSDGRAKKSKPLLVDLTETVFSIITLFVALFGALVLLSDRLPWARWIALLALVIFGALTQWATWTSPRSYRLIERAKLAGLGLVLSGLVALIATAGAALAVAVYEWGTRQPTGMFTGPAVVGVALLLAGGLFWWRLRSRSTYGGVEAILGLVVVGAQVANRSPRCA